MEAEHRTGGRWCHSRMHVSNTATKQSTRVCEAAVGDVQGRFGGGRAYEKAVRSIPSRKSGQKGRGGPAEREGAVLDQ